MARGWESKSVEEQIQERASKSNEVTKAKLSPAELEKRNKREALLMVRARTLSSLQTACDGRYRGHLETVLADLDQQLAALE
jgi:hypothetical protein